MIENLIDFLQPSFANLKGKEALTTMDVISTKFKSSLCIVRK